MTATTEAAMTILAHQRSSPPDEDRTIVISPSPGNNHELGAMALGHWLEMSGWNAIYLGKELPASEVASAVQDFEARLLALSVALSTQLEATIDTIRAARATRPDIKVLVGGHLLEEVPELWRKMGADGTAAGLGEAASECARLIDS